MSMRNRWTRALVPSAALNDHDREPPLESMCLFGAGIWGSDVTCGSTGLLICVARGAMMR
jgi:hypothetical protein